MKRNKTAFAGLALLTVGALALAGCASGDSGDAEETGDAGASDAIITTNGTEPENPLIPTMTNEVGGGQILDAIFAGLVSYEGDGTAVNDMAEEITVEDPQHLTVKLKEGQTFTNGEEVTADNFIEAWNYGAQLSNAHANSYFFEDIEGFSWDADSELTGLEQVDDYTFTIALNKPASDFAQRLGYSAFYPLPDVAFEDMEAYGQNPIGNGPYMFAGEDAWQHDVQIDLVKNEDYQGVRQAQNGGLTIKVYASADAAYADLQGNEVDVIDVIPPSSMASFESDLGDRAVNQAAAIFQSFTIPQTLPHFEGEEGALRRQAISMAINREEITETIFQGSRTPASDFTSPVIDGWSDSLEGAEVLEFNPERAVELWAEADEISPWEGTFQIGYNSDGGHDQWVDAVSNSLKNTLGIEASGAPYPTFAELRELVNNRTITTAFRSGWQADYPGLYNFLGPLYATNAGSNDGDYSSAEFDQLLSDGISATDPEEANALFSEAQSVLLQDLPAIPLWYSNVTGGFSENVDNVEFGWNSVPLYHLITKAE
ncbi:MULTISPECIES: ABC transporter substrate-binding protein [unclassified Microbacterium]|uniref:peptide ABC transporter substrate-binding protein n=1 Tax=unclassified Microbacterium TaxID=2609290 RepID=UPI00214C223F|nr:MULTISPECIES: ABC transporter substrate-binding protein [unclassified Microbacterium]MCR2784437.1 ABC transporter substrate-binding protein [Microbacterium sp. zg.B96]MDL5350654.1 ABC transporter substrate-binding protein [Microbacterium sp. zg-YB36]WIM14750.1 ABC transporter substrate-binding protein [Microbacterium sp. zg-B96]